MVEIGIPRYLFEGQLPPVCALTGERATMTRKVKAENPRGIELLGLFLGLIPYVLLRSALRKDTFSQMPFCEATWKASQQFQTRRKRIGLAILVCGGAGVFGVLGLNLVDDQSPFIGLLVMMVFGSVVSTPLPVFLAFEKPHQALKMVFKDKEDVVLMKNVHPNFAQALQQQAWSDHHARSAWQDSRPQLIQQQPDFHATPSLLPQPVAPLPMMQQPMMQQPMMQQPVLPQPTIPQPQLLIPEVHVPAPQQAAYQQLAPQRPAPQHWVPQPSSVLLAPPQSTVQGKVPAVPPGAQRPRAAAGWHRDPQNPSRLRYWDGARWTERVADPSGIQPSGPRTAQPAPHAPIG